MIKNNREKAKQVHCKDLQQDNCMLDSLQERLQFVQHEQAAATLFLITGLVAFELNTK
jgi:hypothetical protein